MEKVEKKQGLLLRLPADLHRKLKEEARDRQISINRLCMEKLRKEDRKVDSELVERILSGFGDVLEGVLLFGSTARGEATETSDKDLLLVLRKNATLSRDLYRKWDRHFPKAEDRVYSPQFVLLKDTKELGGIWFESAIDGILFYDRSGKVGRTLSKIRRMISDQVIQKKSVQGHSYWVRRT